MSYLNCKREKGKKIKEALPKYENFQILKHQSPLSIAQHFCYEMLTNFYI